MRFDTPIYFQRILSGDYDAETGNYKEDTVIEAQKWACKTDVGAQTQHVVFGELREGSLILRLQQPYTEPFDRIRVGDKVYAVDTVRKLRFKQVFIVHEVQ